MFLHLSRILGVTALLLVGWGITALPDDDHGNAQRAAGSFPRAPVAPKFPCDLAKLASKVRVHLVGEVHPTSHPKYREISQRNFLYRTALLRSGARGNIYLGLECAPPGQVEPSENFPHPQVFCTEDLLAFEVGHALFWRNYEAELRHENEKVREQAKMEVLHRLMPDHEFGIKAWKEFRSGEPFREPPGAEDLAKLLDRFVRADAGSDEKLKMVDKIGESPLWDNVDAFLAVRKAELLALGRLANKQPYRQEHHVPDLQSYFAFVNHPESAYRGFYEDVEMGWRNDEIAQNLANLICQSARDGKELYAVYGMAHIPGLYERLMAAGVPFPVSVHFDNRPLEPDEGLRRISDFVRQGQHSR